MSDWVCSFGVVNCPICLRAEVEWAEEDAAWVQRLAEEQRAAAEERVASERARAEREQAYRQAEAARARAVEERRQRMAAAHARECAAPLSRHTTAAVQRMLGGLSPSRPASPPRALPLNNAPNPLEGVRAPEKVHADRR